MSGNDILYKALYDFKAEEPDELPLKKEEVIEVVSKEQDPWWIGRNNNGDDGFVPSNYLLKWALPPGWKTAVDAESGDTYYYDANGAVQWDPPGMASPRVNHGPSTPDWGGGGPPEALPSQASSSSVGGTEIEVGATGGGGSVAGSEPGEPEIEATPEPGSSGTVHGSPGSDLVIPSPEKRAAAAVVAAATAAATESRPETLEEAAPYVTPTLSEQPSPSGGMDSEGYGGASEATEENRGFQQRPVGGVNGGTLDFGSPSPMKLPSGGAGGLNNDLKELAKYRREADEKINKLKSALERHEGGSSSGTVSSSQMAKPKDVPVPSSSQQGSPSRAGRVTKGLSPSRSAGSIDGALLEQIVEEKVQERMKPILEEVRSLLGRAQLKSTGSGNNNDSSSSSSSVSNDVDNGNGGHLPPLLDTPIRGSALELNSPLQPHVGSGIDDDERDLNPGRKRVPRLNIKQNKASPRPAVNGTPSLPSLAEASDDGSVTSARSAASGMSKDGMGKARRRRSPRGNASAALAQGQSTVDGAHQYPHGGLRYSKCKSVVYPPSWAAQEEALEGIDRSPPDSQLKLKHIHGYDGDINKHGGNVKRKNIFWLADGRVVYPAAAVVVILDVETNVQSFFTAHTEEVTALAVHKNGEFIASAQMGRGGRVLVWNGMDIMNGRQESQEAIELFTDPQVRSITEIDFSPDGQLLAVMGAADTTMLTIFDWNSGTALATARLSERVVSQMSFNPFLFDPIDLEAQGEAASPNKDKRRLTKGCYTLVTCGSRVVKFWTLRRIEDASVVGEVGGSPNKRKRAKFVLEGNPGVLSRSSAASQPDMTCFCVVADEPMDHMPAARIFTGTSSGSIFIWQQLEDTFKQDTSAVVAWQPRGRLMSVVTDVHDGPIIDLDYTGPEPYDPQSVWSERLISCSKDGIINVWRLEKKVPEQKKALPFEHLASADISAPGVFIGYPRSLRFDAYAEAVVVGTTGNAVCLLLGDGLNKASDNPTADLQLRTLVNGHTGKVCHIAQHPSLPLYVTVSPDKTVRLWDARSRRQLGINRLVGKATCASFSSDGTYVAVGNEIGELAILTCAAIQNGVPDGGGSALVRSSIPISPRGEANGWEVLLRRNVGARVSRTEGKAQPKSRKHSKSEVMTMRFSPGGDILALACRDGLIHLLSVQNGFKRVAVCRGHSSFVTHLDFSIDGRVLQSNDMGRSLLFWDVWEGGKLISQAARTRDVRWASWTCVYGWPCQGLFGDTSGAQEESEINAACLSDSGSVLACGSTNTMNGAVKLFRYPCMPGAVPKQYPGHISPVLDVKFLTGDDFLVSAGGNDTCIFLWDHV